MKVKIVRVIGALLGALSAMVGASITMEMDWAGFLQLFTGAGAPIIVLGLLGVVWTAWNDSATLKRPKIMNKVLGGK